VRKDFAYWVPLVVAIAIVAVGAVFIVGDSDVLDPKSTTTVTTAEVNAVSGTRKTTNEVVKQKGTQTKTTTTTEEQPGTPSQPQKTVTTTAEGERSLLERVLGDGGLVVLQLGIVLLAAFLAAAILQRAILGEYAVKLGSLELPALAPADTTADALDALETKIDKLDQDRRDGAATVTDNLAVLYKRLDLLEKRAEP
jgi:hypothetical protein